MSYELIAILMFSSMMLMLMTGQRVSGPSALSPLSPRSCSGGTGAGLISAFQPR